MPETKHSPTQLSADNTNYKKMSPPSRYDVVIIGGGAAGTACASSLLKRTKQLRIVIVEPSEHHYYQPGWTLVGAGVFTQAQTIHKTADSLPKQVTWIKAEATTIDPYQHLVSLNNEERLSYQTLVVCPGLSLNWQAIKGLPEALGQQGVTSNYHLDFAPYTWQQVKRLTKGRAIFTQPAMPIKCAGAPQKAVYLSCDYWRQQQQLAQIDVDFHLAGAALFGVSTFVPALQSYIERYGVNLHYNSNLIEVDVNTQTAYFSQTTADDQTETIGKPFDLLHVVPPQQAPAFIRNSPLSNAAGWVDVDPYTLRHNQFDDIFSLGDAASTSNAKTAAAIRKQAPVVAENLLAFLKGHSLTACYDGYGACPLTVERGKVILAEFGYDGKLLPTLPLNPTIPRRSYWQLKTHGLPFMYWKMLLKGHEWLAKPKQRPVEAVPKPQAQPSTPSHSNKP
ncbi:NAD(P)/FAD-dependent oxidoreductase [Zooshikella sp. RANM57]|uniref:NAD(P)/FAD-dependent oxidoreductase n=1 Tax=Zooshikella sp. RANM57 TaxID=3425863 RepID=UPI003D6FFB2F